MKDPRLARAERAIANPDHFGNHVVAEGLARDVYMLANQPPEPPWPLYETPGVVVGQGEYRRAVDTAAWNASAMVYGVLGSMLAVLWGWVVWRVFR